MNSCESLEVAEGLSSQVHDFEQFPQWITTILLRSASVLCYRIHEEHVSTRYLWTSVNASVSCRRGIADEMPAQFRLSVVQLLKVAVLGMLQQINILETTFPQIGQQF